MRSRAFLLLALAGLLLCLAYLPPDVAAQLRLPQSRRSTRPPAAPVEPASDETTIKVDVNLVTFTATVTDGYGRYIPSMRREQFLLLENGLPQAISLFHNEVVPVSVGVVVDTSGSMSGKIGLASEALTRFVTTIQPDDDVFLMRFSGDVNLELDFTGNRALFAEAARRLEARGATRLYDALAEALEKVSHGRHRKKAILLISDGMDTSSNVAFDEILEMARQSEVLIYSMGIGRAIRGGGFGVAGPGGRIWRTNRRGQEDGVDMELLQTLADASGARAFHLDSARFGGADLLEQATQEVSAELRQQYTIGYYPTNPARDGSFRTIELRSAVPGIRARHRRGYYAPRDIASR